MHIPDFSTARALVVGDMMLDRYWQGPTLRISPEAPVPVVRVEQVEERPGGASNVALNVVTPGSQVALLGLTGDDAAGDALQARLAGAGVRCEFQRVRGSPTITKLRVLSRNQQLIHLDFEQGFTGFDNQALLARFRALLTETDVVILSDYGKGTLRDAQALINAARAAEKPVLVDPKSRDFSLYTAATLITPNLAEFEAVVDPCPDEQTLVERGRALLRAHDLEALLITRGEHGMTLLQDGQPELHLPALAREVYDVTGAGDTVISTVAAALAAGEPLPTAVALANLAAGVVVGKLGTATVSVPELMNAVGQGWEPGRGVLHRRAAPHRRGSRPGPG